MKRFVFAAAVLALAVPAMAEQVDNPQYKTWAPYKPGTFVALKTTMEMTMPGGPGGMKSESTMTRKLVEITPEKAVVETTVTSEMMGRKHELPASKQEIPAKVEKEAADKAFMPPSQDVKATVKDVKVGKEKIEVAGKTLDTATHEATIEGEVRGKPVVSHIKSWVSTEIPGGLVKAERTSDAPMKTTSTTVLVDYKVEK